MFDWMFVIALKTFCNNCKLNKAKYSYFHTHDSSDLWLSCSQYCCIGLFSSYWPKLLSWTGLPSVGKFWLCYIRIHWLPFWLREGSSFCRTVFYHFHANSDCCLDHIRENPCEDIFHRGVSVAALLGFMSCYCCFRKWFCDLASDKVTLLVEIFSENSNLDDWEVAHWLFSL